MLTAAIVVGAVLLYVMFTAITAGLLRRFEVIGDHDDLTMFATGLWPLTLAVCVMWAVLVWLFQRPTIYLYERAAGTYQPKPKLPKASVHRG